MISEKDYRRMELAASMARQSEMKHRLGAAIYCKNGLALGFNKHKTHPRFATRTIHAELAALLDAARTRTHTAEATAYVARTNRAGDRKLAKPCAYCLHYLKEAGIARVVWTTEFGEYGEMKL